MMVALFQSECPIESSEGSGVSESKECVNEQAWSPYTEDEILYCCSTTRSGEG